MAQQSIPPDIKIGDTFGRLTVSGDPRFAGIDKHRNRIWLVPCKCSCGTRIEANAARLKAGRKRSCNCLMREMGAVNGRVMQKWRHSSKVHPEYVVWRNMMERCLRDDRDSSSNYAERGITVCERWRSFDNFMDDMGPRPSPEMTLERIDNDGLYEPGNCRWATDHDQRRNQRRNRYVTFKGRRMCVSDAAKACGLRRATVSTRLDRGWSDEDALTTPPLKFGQRLA